MAEKELSFVCVCVCAHACTCVCVHLVFATKEMMVYMYDFGMIISVCTV